MSEPADKPVRTRKESGPDPDASEPSVSADTGTDTGPGPDNGADYSADYSADDGADTAADYGADTGAAAHTGANSGMQGADGERGPEPSRAELAMQELSRVHRPVEMFVGGLFLTLAALPLVLVGFALALQVGAIGANLHERLAGGGAGLDVGSLVLLFRFAGVALLIIGVLFLAFTWATLKPKRWARTAVSVLAVVEILLLVGAMIATTVDPVSLGLVLLAGAGVALLYLPRSEEFLLTSR